MQKSKIMIAAVALTLLGSSAALADKHAEKHKGEWNHGKQVSAAAHERNAERKAEHKAERKHARWVKGHSFPREYRVSKYYVTDWHKHKLRKPPKGYRWYHADDDYVLVRRKDNVIFDIINALQ